MPPSRRRRVDQALMSCSPSRTVPVAARRPSSASTSSTCPLPSTPAMPTTSPRCTCSATSSTTGRPSGLRTVRCSTASSTTSVTVDSRVSGVGSSLPTISSASSSAWWCRRATVATVVPARSTVTVSATRSTSSSLWLMKTTATPSARRPASEANSSSTSCGTRTAVGSSRIEHPGAAVEDLEDLDALPLADAEVLDERVGIDAEAVALGELADPGARRAAVRGGRGGWARRRGRRSRAP